MIDAIVLGLLALLDLGFLVLLRVRRSRRKSKEKMSELLNGYVRRENGYQIPKRRRLLMLKAS
jgi:hypothetical protein